MKKQPHGVSVLVVLRLQSLKIKLVEKAFRFLLITETHRDRKIRKEKMITSVWGQEGSLKLAQTKKNQIAK